MHTKKILHSTTYLSALLSGVLGAFGLIWSAGCDDSGDEANEQAQDEAVGQAKQFVVWSPTSSLVTEHGRWHNTSTCINTTTTTKVQPLAADPPCVGRPGRGEAFLMWHRNFLQRLRDSYATNPGAGTPDDALTWTEIPSIVKSQSAWVNNGVQTAENNILNLRTATQAQPTLDEFGVYVEQAYHNFLHTAASTAYPSDSIIGNVTNSPTSTYFFKIHGLIDWHLERFMRANFSGTVNTSGVISTSFPPDGRADLLVRLDTTPPTTEVRLQQELTANAITTRTAVSLPADPATPAGQECFWYVGAVADLNTDGWNDLVWHGPGCNLTKVWYMRGTTRIAGAAGEGDLTNPQSGMNGTWMLRGAVDFNYDRHPDLVWTHGPRAPAPNTGSDIWDVEIWQMKRAARVLTTTVAMTIGTGNAIPLVVDYNDNGYPDFMVGFDGPYGPFSIQHMTRRSVANGPMLTAPILDGSPADLGVNLYDTRFQGFGRFSLANREPDFALVNYYRTGNFHYFRLHGSSNSWLDTTSEQTLPGRSSVVGPH